MQQSPRQNTKEALIRAAERLFAEKGLGGVSVKDITRAAGARNESALHYHFGGVDALIREVFANRYREIEAERVARLAELRLNKSSDDIEAVLEAAIAPFMAACLTKDGRLYARFCVQLATDPRFEIADLISDIGMPSLETMRGLLMGRLRGIPNDIVATRLRRTFIISLIIAADYARQIERGAAPPVEAATREAAATLAGFLRTASPKTTARSTQKKS
ncbi:MAG: TetR family transcriptional regulator [Alphaproteobacteria bacterium]|nr:TetR family transcriptional regulator [Alphaproteobacteria bacterium]